MAPEIMKSGNDDDLTIYSKSVDLWAFGCFMHEVAAGKCPFEDSSDPNRDLITMICEDPVEDP